MYSSEDFERFYFQYQTEALPHGISMQSFCSTHQVPYNLFSKWYKDTRKKVVEVVVDGRPEYEDAPDPSESTSPVESSPTSSHTRLWRLIVDIRLVNILQKRSKSQG